MLNLSRRLFLTQSVAIYTGIASGGMNIPRLVKTTKDQNVLNLSFKEESGGYIVPKEFVQLLNKINFPE